MLEFAGILFGALFAFFLLRNVWGTFKWRVLGIKPNILDEKLVRETVVRFARYAHACDKQQAEREGRPFTAEKSQQYLTNVENLLHMAIEGYIDCFMKA